MGTVQDDRRARFEAVIGTVGEPLRRYFARRTDAATAEDVLAETFLVIWRRVEDVPTGAELPWCYAVARNCLANAHRSARRQRGLVLRIARTTPPEPVDEPPAGRDEEVHRALADLRPADRELLMLWAWEDLRPAEIALVLGITVNAVNIRMHRARRNLTGLLAAQVDGKPSSVAGQKPVEERRTP